MTQPSEEAKPTNGTETKTTAITPVTEASGEPTIAAFASSANFTAAQRMANALASSSLVPQAYRGNIANVLVALELAQRIGASVFMVMQNLDIIHGTPGWRAKFLIATVNASSRFTSLRWRFEGKPGSDDWGARAYATDKADGQECVGPLVSMAMAKAEGWAKKEGSKWKTMPEVMLMYRSAAFWTRLYAPELSLGIQTAEEIEDSPQFLATPIPEGMAPGKSRELEAALTGAIAEAPPAPPSEPTREPGSDDE